MRHTDLLISTKSSKVQYIARLFRSLFSQAVVLENCSCQTRLNLLICLRKRKMMSCTMKQPTFATHLAQMANLEHQLEIAHLLTNDAQNPDAMDHLSPRSTILGKDQDNKLLNRPMRNSNRKKMREKSRNGMANVQRGGLMCSRLLMQK